MNIRADFRLGSRTLLLVLLAVASTVAGAHGLDVVAQQQGAVVTGRALYSDGTPAANDFVQVRTAQGHPVISGLVGVDGRFRFEVAADGGPYRVVVEGEEGHRAQAEAARADASPASGGNDLRLVREDIAALRRQLWLHDVIGGIGYFLGVAGLLAYLAARRRSRG